MRGDGSFVSPGAADGVAGTGAVAALCTVVLVLLAIPVFDKPGRLWTTPPFSIGITMLGLWISIAVVWRVWPGYLVGRRFLPVRHNQVVESKSADDVGDQPPASWIAPAAGRPRRSARR
ncbi:hypothetical protein I545_6699 [Mycobacterium kansasii 662]|uniref:Transmembrane protein n=1 Tax=Mycobacterium kansasii 662 TaxID=1299326 RepID=X7XYW3_MYCKA|nr:hypothetical protein I545_6699 [Mycobacterium kansasii 662]